MGYINTIFKKKVASFIILCVERDLPKILNVIANGILFFGASWVMGLLVFSLHGIMKNGFRGEFEGPPPFGDMVILSLWVWIPSGLVFLLWAWAKSVEQKEKGVN
jgi:hypothetical protein